MSAPIYSMTGYASIRVEISQTSSCTLTLKSVNHRFLDLSLRLPPNCDALEAVLRKSLKEHLRRGHVELTLLLDRQSRAGIAFNDELLAAYVSAFRAAAATNGLVSEPDLNDILRIPGMMSGQQVPSREDGAAMESAVVAALPGLFARFNASRGLEGAALASELRASMARLDVLAERVSVSREGARSAAFERLRERIAELTQGTGVSEERLLVEAAMLAERSDIEEEIVRLRTHAARFAALLDEGGELGKRLDFLLQELNREANTLLSKTGGAASQNGLGITELGLEMKLEIERAREQVQNLE